MALPFWLLTIPVVHRVLSARRRCGRGTLPAGFQKRSSLAVDAVNHGSGLERGGWGEPSQEAPPNWNLADLTGTLPNWRG